MRRLCLNAIHARLIGRAADDGLGAELRHVCDCAHEQGLRAEQLLIVVKAAWRELPESRETARFDEQEALAHVLTRCIEAYYTRE